VTAQCSKVEHHFIFQDACCLKKLKLVEITQQSGLKCLNCDEPCILGLLEGYQLFIGGSE
jgi:hypothetical protein